MRFPSYNLVKGSIQNGTWSFRVQICPSQASENMLLHWTDSEAWFYPQNVVWLALHSSFLLWQIWGWWKYDLHHWIDWGYGGRSNLAHFQMQKGLHGEVSLIARPIHIGFRSLFFFFFNWIPHQANIIFCGACPNLLNCRLNEIIISYHSF